MYPFFIQYRAYSRQGMRVIFLKRKNRTKKGKIFENLDKNVQHLKTFWKRADDFVWLSHAINC